MKAELHRALGTALGVTVDTRELGGAMKGWVCAQDRKDVG